MDPIHHILVQQARALIGRGGYDPMQWSCANLPMTMRDLLEKDWDKADDDSASGRRITDIDNPAHRLLQVPNRLERSAIPVCAADLHRRIAAPVFVSDYRGWKTILASYWHWLPKSVRKTIRIDHSLSSRPWPLADHLNKKLANDFGTSLAELLWINEFEPDAEINGTNHVMIPCFDLYDEGDQTLLIEFLECSVRPAIRHEDVSHFQFPEAVLDWIGGDEKTKKAGLESEYLQSILVSGRFDLLPEEWQKACRALAAYPDWPIGFPFESYDCGGWHEPVTTAEELNEVFKILKEVAMMQDAIAPLCNHIWKAGGIVEFFQKLIDHLRKSRTKTPVIKPRARRGKTLCEVLA